MKPVVVIADAGPLIALARIGRIHLLRDLFANVMVTETVQQEVLAGGKFAESVPIEEAIQAGWLQVKASPDAADAADLEWLDPGERSAILLALEYRCNGNTPRLVIDEAKGRAAAKGLSLELIGSVGIIATAKHLSLIPAARPLLEQLQHSGYYLSPPVIHAALDMAGETPPASEG